MALCLLSASPRSAVLSCCSRLFSSSAASLQDNRYPNDRYSNNGGNYGGNANYPRYGQQGNNNNNNSGAQANYQPQYSSYQNRGNSPYSPSQGQQQSSNSPYSQYGKPRQYQPRPPYQQPQRTENGPPVETKLRFQVGVSPKGNIRLDMRRWVGNEMPTRKDGAGSASGLLGRGSAVHWHWSVLNSASAYLINADADPSGINFSVEEFAFLKKLMPQIEEEVATLEKELEKMDVAANGGVSAAVSEEKKIFEMSEKE